jgi:hypothetical protein
MLADGSRVDDADWASVSDVARQRGVTRQAISKRVKALAGRGKLSTQGEGRNLRFHLPTFDALTAAAHDPAQDLRNRHQRSGSESESSSDEPSGESAKEKRQRPVVAQDLANSSSYDAASAREKNAKAELAEMRLAQERGELVKVRDIEVAAVNAGTKIAQAVSAMKAKAGKLYAAAATGGEEALHIELVKSVNDVLKEIGDSMATLAALGAEESD